MHKIKKNLALHSVIKAAHSKMKEVMHVIALKKLSKSWSVFLYIWKRVLKKISRAHIFDSILNWRIERVQTFMPTNKHNVQRRVYFPSLYSWDKGLQKMTWKSRTDGSTKIHGLLQDRDHNGANAKVWKVKNASKTGNFRKNILSS